MIIYVIKKAGAQNAATLFLTQKQSGLTILNVSKKYRHKSFKINNKRYNLDAYDPITNTIYEFYGDYWHGNPKVFDPNSYNKTCKKYHGELYMKTLKKEEILKRAGYNIISI